MAQFKLQKLLLAFSFGLSIFFAPHSVKAINKEQDSLYAMAVEKFGKNNLSQCEEKLLKTAENGGVADCRSQNTTQNDPATAACWGQERQIRSDLIEWLGHDPNAKGKVRDTGIQILGARIQGNVNLSYANLSFPLIIKQSAIPDNFILVNAHGQGTDPEVRA